jgi:hypothetical protein
VKLTNVRRLLAEDFPDQKWIGKLLQPLNQFIENVTQALTKNLTVADNLDQQISEVTFTGNASVQFKAALRTRPRGVVVSDVQTVTGTAPTAAVQPASWSYNSADQTITISSWHGGLHSSSKYRVTLWIHTN